MKRYNYSGGSSAIVSHLRKEHSIMLSSRQEARRNATQSRLGDITALLGHDALPATKKRKATAEPDALDQATLRELYCRYTVACSLPFAHVEQPAFRDLIRYIRPVADDLLPMSGSTVKIDLQNAYDNKKEFVKRALQNALSSIHIVPDNWTSPNCLGVIGFTAQFVTEDHGLQSIVLRIRELDGQHSGENMAEAIMEFIREYGIASKVGYFMMDNASNMNTMIDKVSDELEHEFDVFYDPLPHRLRCFGHIINLAVMELLIGNRPPTTDPYHGPSDEEVEQWRKRGAIGKLHNIVVYITWTPQRLKAFTALTDGLRLRRDNDTRWNSWYRMVEWVLRPRIRHAVTIFCAQEPALQEDVLTSSDWATLAEIHGFLEPFHDATIANEGMRDSICNVLPTMDYLLHHIEAAKKATSLPQLATMMETAWAKLADYYELTEDSPVYSAATVLNPSLKWAYMEKTWEDRTEWVDRAKARVGQLWRETYKSTESTACCSALRSESTQEPTPKRPNGYKMWMSEQKATIFNMDDDEYEVYCREPVIMDIVSPVYSTAPMVYPGVTQYQNQQALVDIPYQSLPLCTTPGPGHETFVVMGPGVQDAREMPYRRGSRTTAKPKPKPLPYCTGHRPVSSLTHEQLQLKRANDREYQRVNRLRKQKLISSLRKDVQELKELQTDDSETIRQLRQHNQDLQIELISLCMAIGIPYSSSPTMEGTAGNAASSSTTGG
ncbi:transposase-like protein [Purpureocillium lavendulum]|uniref:Transposase-like protein n=1 Tax=Purpureocillium lavendulum TaxID=1247861 RepID=A0AB34FBE8_9HYPO|nr:transposase-like protein [Purpureocillium lavendulum]KAJ6436510.1 transposase-like protein [Purpureocillium lavendulum]